MLWTYVPRCVGVGDGAHEDVNVRGCAGDGTALLDGKGVKDTQTRCCADCCIPVQGVCEGCLTLARVGDVATCTCCVPVAVMRTELTGELVNELTDAPRG